MQNQVTAIIAVHGELDLHEVTCAVRCLQMQIAVALEIVISEEHDEPRFRTKAAELGVRYVFTHRSSLFFPGSIKNAGIANVETEFCYFTDKDIFFQNQYYLSNLVRFIGAQDALCRPPRRSISKSQAARILDCVHKSNFADEIKQMLPQREYLVARCAGSDPDVVRHEGMDLSLQGVGAEQNNETTTQCVGEDTFENDVFDIGGIMVRTDTLFDVGGYCEKYQDYRFTNIDLQWKLSELYSTAQIPNQAQFEVLHLDHAARASGTEQDETAARLFLERKRKGVRWSILNDRNLSRLPYGKS